MADVKYTPGDWGWQQGSAGNADQWCLGPGVLLVDGTDGTPGGDSIDRANAHLIAASPDLYEAVSALISMIEDSLFGVTSEEGVFVPGQTDVQLRADGSYMLSDAIAALKKAEGQS